MVPAETGASDLSPKATVQPLRRAVGRTATGAVTNPPSCSALTGRESSGKGVWKETAKQFSPLVASQGCCSTVGLRIIDKINQAHNG